MAQETGTPRKVETGEGRSLAAALFGDTSSERVLLFDSGSFGSWVDGAHLCRELAGRGWLAVTHSRAGMYPSEPAPDGVVLDPRFHVADMMSLLDALDISTPIVLAGHSMAGLRLHHAGNVAAERLRALAFIDAVCPSLAKDRTWAGWTVFAKTVAETGVQVMGSAMGPLLENFHPNLMELDGDERLSKIKSISSPEHLATASAEFRAMDRQSREVEVDEALHMPAFFATATAASQGTTALMKRYAREGTWAERVKFKSEGHLSILTPPAIERIADGIDELWEVSEAA
ncbi:MAG: alpha/beta hydrolase [Pseudomonadota bacterium]